MSAIDANGLSAFAAPDHDLVPLLHGRCDRPNLTSTHLIPMLGNSRFESLMKPAIAESS